MKKKRLTFDIPGLVVRGRTERDAQGLQRQADRDAAQVQKEVGGPTYQLVSSQQRQQGEPVPHGVGQYEHVQPLGEVLDPGGPRIWPVSQEIEHGPEPSRSQEFEKAVQEAAAYKRDVYRAAGFNDRRFSGRRHRPTDNEEELEGPQEPYEY